MANIVINQYGGTIIICESIDQLKAKADEAKDKLLNKMYFARHKQTLGGYAAWKKLCDMYYCEDYEGMREYIADCKGYGGKTRKDCIACLDIIIAYERR